MDFDREPGCVPRENGDGRTADETRNLLEDGTSPRGIDGRVVDLAVEKGKSARLDDRHPAGNAVRRLTARKRQPPVIVDEKT
jgi:hypothetical protein